MAGVFPEDASAHHHGGQALMVRSDGWGGGAAVRGRGARPFLYDQVPKRLSVSTAEFDTGEFTLRIDGKPAGKISVRLGRGILDVLAGEHRVELLK